MLRCSEFKLQHVETSYSKSGQQLLQIQRVVICLLSGGRNSPTGPWMHRSNSFSLSSDVWSSAADVTCCRLWTWTHTDLLHPAGSPPLFVPTVWCVVRWDLRLQCFPLFPPDLWGAILNSDTTVSLFLLLDWKNKLTSTWWNKSLLYYNVLFLFYLIVL